MYIGHPRVPVARMKKNVKLELLRNAIREGQYDRCLVIVHSMGAEDIVATGEMGETALMLASAVRNPTLSESLTSMLLRKGADPNHGTDTSIGGPLVGAVVHRNTATVRLLLQESADPNAAMNKDRRDSALALALSTDGEKRETKSIVTMLIGAGGKLAEPISDYYTQDEVNRMNARLADMGSSMRISKPWRRRSLLSCIP